MLRVIVKTAKTFLADRYPGGRNISVLPDDIFIVSYPRSGNTWMRFLLANLISPGKMVTFATLDRKVPDIYKVPQRALAGLPRPRILKSHEYFDPRYKSVIYLLRDPRDALVSYYHFHRKKRVIPDGYPLDRYTRRFLAGDLDPFGSWAEHVSSWLATRHPSERFLLIRYEDMLQGLLPQMRRVASFLALNISPQELNGVVARSSSDRMRSLEKEESGLWVETKGSRPDIPFVRTAAAGGWKAALPAELASEVESAWRPLLQFLQYEVGAQDEEAHKVPTVGYLLASPLAPRMESRKVPE